MSTVVNASTSNANNLSRSNAVRTMDGRCSVWLRSTLLIIACVLPSFLKEYLNSAVLDVFSLTLGRAPGKIHSWCTCCGKGPGIGWIFGVLARLITGTSCVSHQLVDQTNEFNCLFNAIWMNGEGIEADRPKSSRSVSRSDCYFDTGYRLRNTRANVVSASIRPGQSDMFRGWKETTL